MSRLPSLGELGKLERPMLIGTAVLLGVPLVLMGVSIAATALVPLTLASLALLLGVWLSPNLGLGDRALSFLESMGARRC